MLARLHRWYHTAWILSRVPLTALDGNSVGRLQYALMMAHRAGPEKSHSLLESLIRRNVNTTPELLVDLAAMATAVGDGPRANSLLEQAGEQAANAHTADAAHRLLAVNRGLMDGTLQTHLSARIEGLTLPLSDEPLTLVPLSSRYLDLWRLWLEQVRWHIGGRIVVIAMDDAAMTATQHEAGVFTLDMLEHFAWDARGGLHPRSRGVLWLLRVLVLREMVRRGHSVLVLDLDAVPVSDLAPMLGNLPAADVVAQKDHSLPMDVNRKLGFVLCCGFMLWRSTPAVHDLLDRFARETAIERDDQMALNHLLAREGLTDRAEDANTMRFRSAGMSFVCPSPSLVSRTLHSGTVVRHFQQEGQSIAELRKGLGLF